MTNKTGLNRYQSREVARIDPRVDEASRAPLPGIIVDGMLRRERGLMLTHMFEIVDFMDRFDLSFTELNDACTLRVARQYMELDGIDHGEA